MSDNVKDEMNPRFWGMLSLAMKAGKLSVGESKAQDAVRGGLADLVILSDDASANTEKKFLNMSEFHSAAVIRINDRYRLGSSIGRKFAVVIAVTDKGFAENLLKLSRG